MESCSRDDGFNGCKNELLVVVWSWNEVDVVRRLHARLTKC